MLILKGQQVPTYHAGGMMCVEYSKLLDGCRQYAQLFGLSVRAFIVLPLHGVPSVKTTWMMVDKVFACLQLRRCHRRAAGRKCPQLTS